MSFTSCELYNPEYGNGIGESKSLSRPGETYTPMVAAPSRSLSHSSYHQESPCPHDHC